MHPWLSYPLTFGPFVIVLLLLGSSIGAQLGRRNSDLIHSESTSLKTVEGSVLGLLALLIGFTFSMAISRYDQRTQLEIEEANAIGTSWLRIGALPEPTRTAAQQLMRQYASVRLAFGTAHTPDETARNAEQTSALQQQIWNLAQASAMERRDGISAILLTSLNDTIDVTEKRIAARENRIPGMAWAMLLFMAFASCLLVGTGIKTRSRHLLIALPIVFGVVLTLVLDLDSRCRLHPRGSGQHATARQPSEMTLTRR